MPDHAPGCGGYSRTVRPVVNVKSSRKIQKTTFKNFPKIKKDIYENILTNNRIRSIIQVQIINWNVEEMSL